VQAKLASRIRPFAADDAVLRAPPDNRRRIDRITKRFPVDREVIGVNLLAMVAYQGLRHGAWHSCLVKKRCRRPAQAVKRERIDFSSSERAR